MQPHDSPMGQGQIGVPPIPPPLAAALAAWPPPPPGYRLIAALLHGPDISSGPSVPTIQALVAASRATIAVYGYTRENIRVGTAYCVVVPRSERLLLDDYRRAIHENAPQVLFEVSLAVTEVAASDRSMLEPIRRALLAANPLLAGDELLVGGTAGDLL